MFTYRPDRVAARTAARLAFGAALILGTIALAIVVRTSLDASPRGTGAAAAALGWTWLAAIGAAAGAYTTVRARDVGPVSPAMFTASFAVPAVGFALLVPISIHYVIGCGIGPGRSSEFEDWVAMSALVAGLAHVMFAVLLAIRATQLARGRKGLAVGWVFWSTVAAGSIPFPLVGSAVVAITGLLVLPFLYAMDGFIAHERAALALPALPMAEIAIRG